MFCTGLALLPLYLMAQLKYPSTRKEEVYDGYHNMYKVYDPYRWLEDDNSKETKEWVKQENMVTSDYLSGLADRKKIILRLTDLWNYAKYSSPFKKNQYYYFFKNDGLQNQAVLFRQEGLNGKPEVFLDPNTFSKDGTAALGSISFSKTGKYFAYTVAKAGSDWQEGFVMEAATGKLVPDNIQWLKFSSFSWYGDEGFYYSGYEKPDEKSLLTGQNQNKMIRYHKIGTEQKEDLLIYVDLEHPFRHCNASLTEDQRFLILNVSEGTSGSELYYLDKTNKQQVRFQQLIPGFKTEAEVIDNTGDKLLILTNDGAPNYKLVLMEAGDPHKEEEEIERKVMKAKAAGKPIEPILAEEANYQKRWKTIIPEKNMALQGVSKSGGYLYASYLKDASTRVYQYTYSGQLVREVKLPGIGSAYGFSGEKTDKEVFYSFSSFGTAPAIYRYDPATGISTLFRKTEVKLDTKDFVTEQLFFKSKDDTRVPMFITYKKGMLRNGQNPVLMSGYGGFNIAETPYFSISNAFFIEQGGIFVSVNLRGGSEYGEKWHQAGMLEHKQNVFNDFIAAAEYLVKQNYTNSSRIAIEGGSNGGLLIGAVMTQRPDLFKVALPAVGVLDMLRYHRFTIGWAWAVEYGNADSANQFVFLYKYSPYHNLKQGVNYPATLITTGDHDDRVVPAHSFKFAARLQDYQAGSNPVLIRIETNAGHGAGKPTSKQIEEAADKMSFTMYHLGMVYKDPPN